MSDPVALTALQAHVGQEAVGELRHAAKAADGLRYRFTYARDLPTTRSAALNMPTSERDYASPNLPAPFEQSLPEMNLALFPPVLWKFVERTPMGLLWASSRRRIGRLRFHAPELEAALPQPNNLRLSADELRGTQDGEALFQHVFSQLRDIPGIAGVQPKLLLSLSPGNGTPRTLNTDTHILKANHPDYPEATLVEWLCLAAAEASGLPVPERQLSGDGRLLAIRRFDLDGDGRPLGFDEVGALLGRNAERKYSGSLEDVAEAVRDYSGNAERGESLLRLFTLCVLNNALRNGDAHLKNFGLVYDHPDAARLSPVYDVLTTRAFPNLQFDAPALKLARRRKWDDYSALFAFGRAHCGLGKAEMRTAMKQVAAGIEKTLPDIATAWQAHAHAAPVLQAMQVEWLNGREALLQALD